MTMRVLLVEDNPGDVRLIKELLREGVGEPVNLEWTDRHSTALTCLEGGKIDVVLLDLGLPDSQGLETFARVSEHAPHVPIVVMSALVDDRIAMVAVEQGAQDYVIKGSVDGPRLARILAHAVQRKRAEQKLREEEARCRVLFEQSPDGIVMLDPTTQLPVEFNTQSHRQLGYSAEEFARLRVSDYEAIEAPEGTRAHFERVLREGRDEFQTKHRTKGGEIRDVLVRAQTIRMAGRNMIHAVFHDFTERQQAEERARQSEKLATMGELLAGVAHELNNPMAVVIGQAALLCKTVTGTPVAARAEKISEAAARCARIVKNFLALARQQPSEREAVSLNRVVREAVELVAYELRVTDIEADFALADDLPALWADRYQLQQVVVNLITNAHHAMSQISSLRRVTLTTWHDATDGRIVLEVADTGPGIPPEIRARIFDPFFTTKPPGEGTGLGLSICQGIIEAHGGTIQVEDRPGHGAVFRVRLPVKAPLGVEREVVAAGELAPVPPKTILVVDDEPEIAALLAEMLSGDGHQVDVAANGVVALEKLGKQTYDLIVSDIKMPELDGPGFYREVEARRSELRGRFVFLTGDTLSAATREFLEQTGVPTLIKPFTWEAVRGVIRRVAN